MDIIARLIISAVIIFAGGFCSGMLAGLHIKDKNKPKHRRKLWTK
jgi:hypothetical protein